MRYLKENTPGIELKNNDMSIHQIPFDTPLWAIAYSINDDKNLARFSSKPTRGIIKQKSYNMHQFIPYKKNTTELRSSGEVHYESRMYADTYDEAVTLFNELVDIRIAKLQKLLNETYHDKI